MIRCTERHTRLQIVLLLLATAGCSPQAAVPRIDASKIKAGMTAEQVRAAAGPPFPGATKSDMSTGRREETWIYPSGDDAVFVTMVNDTVQSVTTKRVTMKDAASKVHTGMTAQEVVGALGEPAGTTGDVSTKGTATYQSDAAALDILTIQYENGRVAKSQVDVNQAIVR